MSASVEVDGPFFEDLPAGRVFDDVPAVTLTDGLAAAHHAIVGGRFRLARDQHLARRVTGRAVVSPALVWDVAIGQSTVVTERVVANLFYRGLVLHRLPAIGDTLRSVTSIVGARPASPRPDRPARGLVTMRIRTVDQEGRTVLDFLRCALIPARDALAAPKPSDDEAEAAASQPALTGLIQGWDLAAFRASSAGPHFDALTTGTTYRITGGDVVSSAPELARLTMNLASVHHDGTRGERLVYGGHTIGLATAQLTRAFPGIVTIVGWESCDHTGPVREGDTLHSSITVGERTALAAGGGLVNLAVRVAATPAAGGTAADVLDWRLVALFA
ncbi:MAG TPA: MaoC family dehydratase [Bauldia sp.]|nr:MaoC family dehydratase [Bauldia sp.]